MLYGSFSALQNDWDYNLFIDDSDVLDPSQQKELAFEDGGVGNSPHNAFERAAGARVSYHFLNDSANIGASFLRYEMYDLRERKDLYGLDALWAVNRMEFSGEWVQDPRYGLQFRAEMVTPVVPTSAEGLMTALKWDRIEAVIDASHPFDAATSADAQIACRALGLPLYHYARPPWRPRPDELSA